MVMLHPEMVGMSSTTITQTPLRAQAASEVQSSSDVQVARQAAPLGSHANGAQLVVSAGRQVPLPLQRRALFSTPSVVEQLAGAHTVPEA